MLQRRFYASEFELSCCLLYSTDMWCHAAVADGEKRQRWSPLTTPSLATERGTDHATMRLCCIADTLRVETLGRFMPSIPAAPALRQRHRVSSRSRRQAACACTRHSGIPIRRNYGFWLYICWWLRVWASEEEQTSLGHSSSTYYSCSKGLFGRAPYRLLQRSPAKRYVERPVFQEKYRGAGAVLEEPPRLWLLWRMPAKPPLL